MKVLHMEVGALGTNCYIALNEETKEAVVIDPGDEGEKIVAAAQKAGAKVVAIFVTHGHTDHITGLAKVREATGAKVYISKEDAPRLETPATEVLFYTDDKRIGQKADAYFTDGEELTVAGLDFKIMATPGHTPGGVCIQCGNVVFCGDTIFAESIGRTDFPGGSYDDIIASIKTKLLPLADDVQLLPGHGPSTTVGWERRRNPFLQ